jgi:ion channel
LAPVRDADTRDVRRITSVWTRVETGLKSYAARACAARILGFRDREGWYLLAALIVLAGLAALASRNDRPTLVWWTAAASLVGLYYVVDSVLVHTSIAFVTHRPVHRLRAIVLTIVNVVNVATAFAVVYASERWCFKDPPLSWIDATYFAFVTVATLGYGDIAPDRAAGCGWIAQLTVVLQVIVGIYFVAVVVTTVVSWAHRPDAA